MKQPKEFQPSEPNKFSLSRRPRSWGAQLAEAWQSLRFFPRILWTNFFFPAGMRRPSWRPRGGRGPVAGPIFPGPGRFLGPTRPGARLIGPPIPPMKMKMAPPAAPAVAPAAFIGVILWKTAGCMRSSPPARAPSMAPRLRTKWKWATTK